MTHFNNVSVFKKANIYFDGRLRHGAVSRRAAQASVGAGAGAFAITVGEPQP